MSQENLPQTVIINQEIARDMAYAEKPYRELALVADSLGLDGETADALAKANTAGVLAGRAAVTTMSQQIEAGVTPEQPMIMTKNAPERTSVWDSLSPEKQTYAKATITAMAEKFDVTETDFTLIKAEQDGKETLTAIYVGNGIDLGDSKKYYDKKRSYNSVMGEKTAQNFFVAVDGEQLDTRGGMTESAYRAMVAMVADAKVRSKMLPDSEQMSKAHGDIWTWTLLTGEPTDGSVARVASVGGGGQAVSGWGGRDDDDRNVRFRPAVVIE